jgi:hypothetical protein
VSSDNIDHVISQTERLQHAGGATPSGRATGRDRSSLGRFDEGQLAAAESLRDPACPSIWAYV